MRIISIESPQQLKDGTVKASITVSEENYIPLILLKVRAQKGDAIEIDDAGEVITEDTPLSLIIEAIMPIIQSQLYIAEKIGYQKALEDEGLITKEKEKEDSDE